jgi:hypothetical protein
MTPTIVETKMREPREVEAPGKPAREWVPGGVAAAALASAMFGMLALAVVNVFTAASPGFNAWVHWVGKLWMPGAAGIGPYSGKETLSLIVWLGSWGVLHLAFRNRDMRISRCLIVFLIGVGIATTLVWPPVFEHLAELLAGH